MPSLGLPELLIILVILLLVFGPKRLPGLGRQLGTGMREFKDSITGKAREEEETEAEATRATPPPALPEGAPPPAPVAGDALAAEDPAAPRG